MNKVRIFFTNYGYSFRLNPNDMLESPDPHGFNEGEDIIVNVYYPSREYLKKTGMDEYFFDRERYRKEKEELGPMHRGHRDPSNNLWQLVISKPSFYKDVASELELIANINNKCRKNRTNNKLLYYVCGNKNSPYFFIFLGDKPESVVFRVHLEYGLRSKEQKLSRNEKLAISKIVNSFKKESEPQEKIISGPTKDDLIPYIKIMGCPGKNTNLEAYENGYKEYHKHSVISYGKLLTENIYLYTPKSYCSDTALNPYEQEGLYLSDQCQDTQKVEQDTDLGNLVGPMCDTPLPQKSYSNSFEGISSLLTKYSSGVTVPRYWHYEIFGREKVAIAIPNTWNAIGSWPDKPSDPPIISKISNPDKTISISLYATGSMQTVTKAEIADEEFVNLGKIECGKYASCNLIRNKINDNYVYELLLNGQPNIIARPPHIFFPSVENEDIPASLYLIDKIAKKQLPKITKTAVTTFNISSWGELVLNHLFIFSNLYMRVNYREGGDELMKTLYKVTLVLLIVGGLNWGLVGLFNFDLVAMLFGQMSALSRLVYSLVGLSAVYIAMNKGKS